MNRKGNPKSGNILFCLSTENFFQINICSRLVISQYEGKLQMTGEIGKSEK